MGPAWTGRVRPWIWAIRSAYLNEVIGLGCRIAEVAEPGSSPQIASQETGGDHPYLHLPNFLIVATDLRLAPCQ